MIVSATRIVILLVLVKQVNLLQDKILTQTSDDNATTLKEQHQINTTNASVKEQQQDKQKRDQAMLKACLRLQLVEIEGHECAKLASAIKRQQELELQQQDQQHQQAPRTLALTLDDESGSPFGPSNSHYLILLPAQIAGVTTILWILVACFWGSPKKQSASQ